MRRLASASFALVLAAGCIRNAAYRLSPQGDSVEARVGPEALSNAAARASLQTSGIEVHDDYRLHFLEFDDQGQAYATAPLTRLAESLRKDAAAPEKPRIVIVLFAHGWLNDAQLCNGNVCCFRTFLSHVAVDLRTAAERSQGFLGPTRVVGVFVGWRGLSATVPPFRSLSFYARKKAAGNIGQGELVEALAFLDRYQKRLNAETPNRCRLVMMGHSFGGAILYSAIANVLKTRIMDARVNIMLNEGDPTIEGFGDLVVLANPAFEASLYAPLHELVGTFPAFGPRQNPLLVVLASETDTTTRLYFKISRWIETIFQRTGPRSPRDMLVRTVGNYDPFVTHRAIVAEDARESRHGTLRGVVHDCECKLPMSDVDSAAVDRILSVFRTAPEDAANRLMPTACPGRERMGVVELECTESRPPGLPLWVVRASDDVVSGHSGFFTRPVTDLVRSLVARRVLEGSIAAAAQRSR